MKGGRKTWLLALAVVVLHGLQTAPASMAQVRRYEPQRPTVSPYLNLFRDDFNNGPLPNYQALVRPLQRQQETNQHQQRLLQQQRRAITRLGSNVQDIERRALTGQLVAPTGQGSWFGRPARQATYLNTSRYYEQAGTAGIGARATAR